MPSDPVSTPTPPTGDARAVAPRRRAIGLAAGGVAAVGLAGWAGLRWIEAPAPGTLPPLAYPIIDGRRLGPDSLRGRIVLVNFWATTCTTCVAEMPELVELYDAYRDRGLELIAIAMPYDRPDRVLDFAATRKLPFPVALDPMGEAVAAWGAVDGTPASWLVAPNGRIVSHWLGRPDFARLRRDIDRLLPAVAG